MNLSREKHGIIRYFEVLISGWEGAHYREKFDFFGGAMPVSTRTL